MSPQAARARTEPLAFLRQFMANPRAVGAIAPSSPALARQMLAPVDFSQPRIVVEFGPGTGAFTGAIRARLAPGSRYLAIEINPGFCAALRAAYPDLDIAQGSVTELDTMLDTRGIGAVDAVISGLPWAALPAALQDAVLPATARRLRPGGVFVTFAYLHGLTLPGARALRGKLRACFTRVTMSPVVWGNVPPALCYVCEKGES